MPLDLPPVDALDLLRSTVAAPGIVRPAEHALLRPGAFRPVSRAERRAIIVDLVRTGRATREEARAIFPLVPVIGWNGATTPPTLAYITSTYNNTNPSDHTSSTYSGTSIGAAGSTRLVVILHTSASGSGNNSVSSVTVGGIAGTIQNLGSGSNVDCAISYTAVPTGTSADVVVGFSGGVRFDSISVYTIHDGNSLLYDYDNPVGGTDASRSVSLDFAANGVGIAGGINATAGDASFTNSTEDHDSGSIGGTYRFFASHHNDGGPGETGRSISLSVCRVIGGATFY